MDDEWCDSHHTPAYSLETDYDEMGRLRTDWPQDQHPHDEVDSETDDPTPVVTKDGLKAFVTNLVSPEITEA